MVRDRREIKRKETTKGGKAPGGSTGWHANIRVPIKVTESNLERAGRSRVRWLVKIIERLSQTVARSFSLAGKESEEEPIAIAAFLLTR